jgi:DNA-binding PadR family transcriptional regulator
MRRKPGALVPLETAICAAAAGLIQEGATEFYGYQVAKRMLNAPGRRPTVAYGTLYRALGRLQQMGLLQSRWEDVQIATEESRPARRLYTLTSAGEAVAREAIDAHAAGTMLRIPGRAVPA